MPMVAMVFNAIGYTLDTWERSPSAFAVAKHEVPTHEAIQTVDTWDRTGPQASFISSEATGPNSSVLSINVRCLILYNFILATKARERHPQVLKRRLHKNKANLPWQVPVGQPQVCKKKMHVSVRAAWKIIRLFPDWKTLQAVKQRI